MSHVVWAGQATRDLTWRRAGLSLNTATGRLPPSLFADGLLTKRKTKKRSTFATILLWSACSAVAQRPSGTVAAFSAEDSTPSRQPAIPAEAWATLIHDEFVQKSLSDGRSQPPRDWFIALPVDLGSAGSHDLVVEGDKFLRGANVNTFWVFVRTPVGLKLALTVSAHDLLIKKARSHGYRFIEAWKASSAHSWSASFRFDGRTYVHHGGHGKDLQGLPLGFEHLSVVS